jgi:predicted transposase YdaD
MPYNLCKMLAEHHLQAFGRWLMGETVTQVQLLQPRLAHELPHANFLTFLQVDNRILHLEFQTQPDLNLPFQMLD